MIGLSETQLVLAKSLGWSVERVMAAAGEAAIDAEGTVDERG